MHWDAKDLYDIAEFLVMISALITVVVKREILGLTTLLVGKIYIFLN